MTDSVVLSVSHVSQISMTSYKHVDNNSCSSNSLPGRLRALKNMQLIPNELIEYGPASLDPSVK